MLGQRGFWDFDDRLKDLSAEGDPLERLVATVDFDILRPVLAKALHCSSLYKSRRSPFDAVLKFKMLVLQSLHGLSLAQPKVRRLLSTDRFSVDGTLIETWAWMKSVRPKNDANNDTGHGGRLSAGAAIAKRISKVRHGPSQPMSRQAIRTPECTRKGEARKQSFAFRAMA